MALSVTTQRLRAQQLAAQDEVARQLQNFIPELTAPSLGFIHQTLPANHAQRMPSGQTYVRDYYIAQLIFDASCGYVARLLQDFHLINEDIIYCLWKMQEVEKDATSDATFEVAFEFCAHFSHCFGIFLRWFKMEEITVASAPNLAELLVQVKKIKKIASKLSIYKPTPFHELPWISTVAEMCRSELMFDVPWGSRGEWLNLVKWHANVNAGTIYNEACKGRMDDETRRVLDVKIGELKGFVLKEVPWTFRNFANNNRRAQAFQPAHDENGNSPVVDDEREEFEFTEAW
jgi:hypothetical protein